MSSMYNSSVNTSNINSLWAFIITEVIISYHLTPLIIINNVIELLIKRLLKIEEENYMILNNYYVVSMITVNTDGSSIKQR